MSHLYKTFVKGIGIQKKIDRRLKWGVTIINKKNQKISFVSRVPLNENEIDRFRKQNMSVPGVSRFWLSNFYGVGSLKYKGTVCTLFLIDLWKKHAKPLLGRSTGSTVVSIASTLSSANFPAENKMSREKRTISQTYDDSQQCLRRFAPSALFTPGMLRESAGFLGTKRKTNSEQNRSMYLRRIKVSNMAEGSFDIYYQY